MGLNYPQTVAKARGAAHRTNVPQIVYEYRVGWFRCRKYDYCPEGLLNQLVQYRPYIRLLKCMPNGVVVQ